MVGDINSIFICNSQNLETTQVPPIGKWINKKIYLYNGIFLKNKKEQTTHSATCLIKIIMLSDRSQNPAPKRKPTKYYMIPFVKIFNNAYSSVVTESRLVIASMQEKFKPEGSTTK